MRIYQQPIVAGEHFTKFWRSVLVTQPPIKQLTFQSRYDEDQSVRRLHEVTLVCETGLTLGMLFDAMVKDARHEPVRATDVRNFYAVGPPVLCEKVLEEGDV